MATRGKMDREEDEGGQKRRSEARYEAIEEHVVVLAGPFARRTQQIDKDGEETNREEEKHRLGDWQRSRVQPGTQPWMVKAVRV